MSETKLTLTQECLDSYEEDARESNLVEVSSLVLLSLIAAARELETRWIPVTERMPTTGVSVILEGGTGYFDGQVWRTTSGHHNAIQWEVTHWMPLPKGPTK